MNERMIDMVIDMRYLCFSIYFRLSVLNGKKKDKDEHEKKMKKKKHTKRR